jgi:hypothetical protein
MYPNPNLIEHRSKCLRIFVVLVKTPTLYHEETYVYQDPIRFHTVYMLVLHMFIAKPGSQSEF